MSEQLPLYYYCNLKIFCWILWHLNKESIFVVSSKIASPNTPQYNCLVIKIRRHMWSLLFVLAFTTMVDFQTFSSQLSIETTSFMNSFSGQRLGTFYTGPQYDVSKSETSERAACILFRCPAVNYINWENMFTYLSGTISAGPKQGCCLRFFLFYKSVYY